MIFSLIFLGIAFILPPCIPVVESFSCYYLIYPIWDVDDLTSIPPFCPNSLLKLFIYKRPEGLDTHHLLVFWRIYTYLSLLLKGLMLLLQG